MKSFLKKHLGDYAYPIVIVIVALVVVGIIAAVVYKNRDKVEAQRTARVIEINGPCNILREGAVINAVADMPLYSGDTFYSGIDASARIMIDDDKFLYLDSTTRINFSASGTPDETHTLIFVETGSMLTEVKEKLADGESFDIVTPNSFMEIHGTKTLTRVVEDEFGNVDTSSAVLEGNVSFTTILKNNGRLLSVREALPAGGSLGIRTDRGALAGNDNMRSIAQTGRSTSGETPASSTYENSGIVRGKAVFGRGFLGRVKGVLLISEQEDADKGITGSDSNGNGVSDPVDNVNALMETEDDDSVADAGDDGLSGDEESEEERLAREEKERLEKEEANRHEKEEAEKRDREEAERLEREEAERLARLEEEKRRQEIIAVEQAQAQVFATLQAQAQAQEDARKAAEEEEARKAAEEQAKIDQDRKEKEAEEAAARAAAEAAAQESSDVHTSDSHDIPDDEEHGGTFTGYYTNTGFPLYINSDEVYYYLGGDSEMVLYEGELYDTPPTTT